MNTDKLYSVYHLYFRNRNDYKSHFASIAYDMFVRKPEDPLHTVSWELARPMAKPTNDRQSLVPVAAGLRAVQRAEQRGSRCICLTHKFVIHECDAQGYWKPSKKELKEATILREMQLKKQGAPLAN